MQKWEYLVLQVVIMRAFGRSSINIGCDNKEIEKAMHGKAISDCFNYLGALGWELVTTTPGSAAASSNLYFKRPIPVARPQGVAAPTNNSTVAANGARTGNGNGTKR